MEIGRIKQYEVVRETNLGYTLTDGEQEYFLHHNECNNQYFQEHDKVMAFLYFDKLKRVAATCFKPYITVDQGGLCEVVNVTDIGAYVNIGINKDILLSNDSLPKNIMPQIGDKVCCKIKVKTNGLYIKLLNKEEIQKLSLNVKLNINDRVTAYVYRINEQGISVVDENFNIIFIYYKNLQKKYRVGEKVEVRIIHENSDGYNGTTVEQKEIAIKEHADKILDYLKSHYGVLNFSEDADALIINKVFNMSKSSFKRALGNLYKQNLITIEPNRVILKNYMEDN